jgi:hypothetical protein
MPSSGLLAAETVVALAPEDPSPLATGALLGWLEEDELVIEELPQPATMRARAVSESTMAGGRGEDIDQLLVVAITAECD